MKAAAATSFGGQLKALREAAGFTQEELATIAGLSVHAVSALERGERRRPHVETVRALSSALDLAGATRDALFASARPPASAPAVDELSHVSLPLPLTALLGREADVNTLRSWLADPAVRLITLTGPGGVGKTRLALELAHASAEDGSNRVIFAPLAAIRDPVFVASAIAEALGLADVAAVDLPGRARLACADHPTVLILDNFEQVLGAAPLVADLLSTAATLKVLATSRAPLRIRGERQYVVGPLELEVAWEAGEAASPPDVTHAPAVRLFMERAREVKPDFRLTSANGPTVSAICGRLDALPLALELAAPWIKVMPVENLLRRLEHDVLLSTIGPRDLPERQQTMNATVAWSYQLLDPDEQRAFRRFGALPGLFPIDAAADVLAGRETATGETDALRAAAGLIDKSLLLRAHTSVVPTCPLYQMLETVQAYAALQLAASGERDDAHEGLVRYCTREAALAATELVGPSQVHWLNRVREDLESYRGALAWLIECGRPAEAADIAWGLVFFWLIRGHATEGLRWYEQILRLPSLTPAVESRALVGAGLMWYVQGDLDRARAALMHGRQCAKDVGDMPIVGWAELMLGHVEIAVGNIESAHDWFITSHERFRALGIPWATGQALSGLAWVALLTGDLDRTERLLDDAALELRDVGSWFLALMRYLRALLAIQRGRPDEAIAWVRDSLTDLRELHDKCAFVYALVPLAAAAAFRDDDESVARIIGVRDAVTESTGVMVVDPSTSDLRERAEHQARARLGPDRWARAYAAGRMASIDGLLKDLDRVEGRHGTPGGPAREST